MHLNRELQLAQNRLVAPLALLISACSFASSSVEIGLAIGASYDSIRLWGERLGAMQEDRTTDIWSLRTQLDGRFCFRQIYFCPSLYYQKVFSTPKHLTYLSGVAGIPTYLMSRYGWGLRGALGYLFPATSCFSLGLQGGYGLQRLAVDMGAYELCASPFAGLQAQLQTAFGLRLIGDLDFHFLGRRKSEFITNTLFIPQSSEGGRYYGPDINLRLDYAVLEYLRIGCAYRFEYLTTTKSDLSNLYIGVRNRWVTHTLMATLGVDF